MLTAKEMVKEANRTEDGKTIKNLMQWLRFKYQATYKETREFFQSCDPSIDDARFEELAQIADYVS